MGNIKTLEDKTKEIMALKKIDDIRWYIKRQNLINLNIEEYEEIENAEKEMAKLAWFANRRARELSGNLIRWRVKFPSGRILFFIADNLDLAIVKVKKVFPDKWKGTCIVECDKFKDRLPCGKLSKYLTP